MGLLVGNLLFPLLVHPQLRSPCSSELRNGATHTWMRVNAGVLNYVSALRELAVWRGSRQAQKQTVLCRGHHNKGRPVAGPAVAGGVADSPVVGD